VQGFRRDALTRALKRRAAEDEAEGLAAFHADDGPDGVEPNA
jgi:hypothetical protein